MKRPITALLLSCALLTGCAFGPFAPDVPPGSPETALYSLYGKPLAVYPTVNGKIIEWETPDTAQNAYMAQVDAAGRVIWHGDVRTMERFAIIVPGQSTKADVLRTIGHPSEAEFLALSRQEVWTYRFREEMIWHSMMHFYFDANGVVTRMEKGLDDIYLRD